MLRVIVVGIGGRMGGEVARLINLQPDLKLVAGIEAPGHPLVGTTAEKAMVVADLNAVINEGDLVVDFSTPKTVMENLKIAISEGKPFITGVTGFTPEDFGVFREAGGKIPVVYAPNFSVGVAVLTTVVRGIARVLREGWDGHIVELHHNRKKDAPSGTAKMLLETIRTEWDKRPIDVSSIRAGDIVGEHRVIFAGPGEHLELVHCAESRSAFASGVIAAVRWVKDKEPGFYSIFDVLGLG